MQRRAGEIGWERLNSRDGSILCNQLNRRKLVLSRLGPGCGVKGMEWRCGDLLKLGYLHVLFPLA